MLLLLARTEVVVSKVNRVVKMMLEGSREIASSLHSSPVCRQAGNDRRPPLPTGLLTTIAEADSPPAFPRPKRLSDDASRAKATASEKFVEGVGK